MDERYSGERCVLRREEKRVKACKKSLASIMTFTLDPKVRYHWYHLIISVRVLHFYKSVLRITKLN